MYTLYHHFLERVKEQQIQKYNKKHRAYLIRSGKFTHQNLGRLEKKVEYTNQNRNKNNQEFRNEQDNGSRKVDSQENKVSQAKPKRQREFNRPNKTQIKNQAVKIDQIHAERTLKNQKRFQSNMQNQYQKKNLDQRQIKPVVEQIRPSPQQFDRPIKQNKLSVQQIQYLNSINSKTEAKSPNPQQKSNVQKQKPIKPLNEAPKMLQQQEEQYQQLKLIECSICGRKFKQQALQKHQNVCERVFQQKRKKFQVKATDQQAQMLKKKSSAAQSDDKAEKKSKWKQQSQMFRNMLQKGRGQKVEDIVQQDLRIQCPGCGRKFDQKVATKHIDFCTKKPKKPAKNK